MSLVVDMIGDEHGGILPKQSQNISASFLVDGEMKICQKLGCEYFEID